jgi:hypothetical protein
VLLDFQITIFSVVFVKTLHYMIIIRFFIYLFSYNIFILIVVYVSFNKKSNNHAQGGGPSRVVNPTPANAANSAPINYASAVQTTPNGSHIQPQFHGKLVLDLRVVFFLVLGYVMLFGRITCIPFYN